MFSLLTVQAVAQEPLPTPKAEIFGTYSYYRLGRSPGYEPADLTKGLGVAGALNLNRWLGAVIDTSHFWGKQAVTNPDPDSVSQANYTLHTLMGGPRFTYRENSKMTPFVNLLIGGARVYRGYGTPSGGGTTGGTTTTTGTTGGTTTGTTGGTTTGTTGGTTTTGTTGGTTGGTPGYPGGTGGTTGGGTASTGPEYFAQTSTVFAWGFGGGLDIKVSKSVAYRLFEADYVMLRPDFTTGMPVHNLRLSTGIALRFGSK
jgi:hypothetical protein